MSKDISVEEFEKLLLEKVDQATKDLRDSIISMFEGFNPLEQFNEEKDNENTIITVLPAENRNNGRLFNWLKGKLTKAKGEDVISDFCFNEVPNGTDVYIVLNEHIDVKHKKEIQNMIDWVSKKAGAKIDDQKPK